jgi:hypothetical protein
LGQQSDRISFIHVRFTYALLSLSLLRTLFTKTSGAFVADCPPHMLKCERLGIWFRPRVSSHNRNAFQWTQDHLEIDIHAGEALQYTDRRTRGAYTSTLEEWADLPSGLCCRPHVSAARTLISSALAMEISSCDPLCLS